MSINIPTNILSLKGQRVNQIEHNENGQQVIIHCNRDRRINAIDPIAGQKGTVNQYVRRQVRDLPFMRQACVLDIELAQVKSAGNLRRIERCDSVDKSCRYTKRLCQLVSGLCRHMSIQAVSRHLTIRWETVKNMDRHYLESSLPALDARSLSENSDRREGKQKLGRDVCLPNR